MTTTTAIQSAERYRFFGVTITQIAPDAFLADSRLTGRRMVLHGQDLELLSSCRTSKTLTLHAEHLVRRRNYEAFRRRHGLGGAISRFLAGGVDRVESVPVLSTQVRRVYDQLTRWCEDGLLIPESQLHKALFLASNRRDARPRSTLSRAAIEVIGIPTSARTHALKRCLYTLTDNLSRHSRSPDVIIMDDSPDQQSQASNCSLIRSLKSTYSGRFYSMDREQRASFAMEIAAKAGVPSTVAEFALMGHAACDRSEGGCRNALLLLSKGKLALQTDDDTICRIGPAPTIEEGLMLTSADISDDYWFFGSFDEAIDAIRFGEYDMLSLHERVLGRSPADLIEEEHAACRSPFTEGIGPGFLDKMGLSESKVRMTLLGPVGDTCLNSDLYRLLLTGDSFERLVEPPERYREHLSTRQVIRCVTRYTVSERLRCIGMNFAIDNRRILPPFMPVQARCDGIFGDLLTVCFPTAFAGQVPYVLVHEPPVERSRTPDQVFELLKAIRVNDIVSALIHGLGNWPHGPASEDRLRTVAQYMMDLGNLPDREFELNVRRVIAARHYDAVRAAAHRLSNDGPPHWRDDVARFIDVLVDSVADSDVSMPADLRGVSVDRTVFKNLVAGFGALLLHWPAMYAAIDDISRAGIDRFLTAY